MVTRNKERHERITEEGGLSRACPSDPPPLIRVLTIHLAVNTCVWTMLLTGVTHALKIQSPPQSSSWECTRFWGNTQLYLITFYPWPAND